MEIGETMWMILILAIIYIIYMYKIISMKKYFEEKRKNLFKDVEISIKEVDDKKVIRIYFDTKTKEFLVDHFIYRNEDSKNEIAIVIDEEEY